MREIKFRAWYPEKKLLFTWQEILIDNIGVFLMRSDGEPETDYSLTPSAILMQFTGLLDKNGTEIYEGDVVKTDSVNIQSGTDCNPYLRVVRFNQEEARFDFYQIDGEKQLAGQTLCKNNLEKRWEVIGNIYENPELVGGK